MLCSKCNNEIPAERLEILPHTTTCVKCSDEPKNVVYMDWYHKTAPEPVVVNGRNREDLRRARRQTRRSR